MAALFLTAALDAQASTHVARHGVPVALPRPPIVRSAPMLIPARSWVEGVTPVMENRLFRATYKTLPSHNVLKVYVFNASGYQSAGIRFSARVPHELRDLTRQELGHEAVSLIRTIFDQFPELQTLDVWATVPVPASQMTHVDSTMFSVSADRETYESIRDRQLSDQEFLAAFGQVWVAPEVPQ